VARQVRLTLAGQAHYVIQRGHNGQRVFDDAADRADYIAALRRAAAAAAPVSLHAYALLDTEVQLLATPTLALALSRMMQAVGRQYVSAYNRRHGRSGTLWDGRFRCAVVEPGASRLQVLALIDGAATDPAHTSAGHRVGARREAWLVDPPEYWLLGNTPFEREAAYRALLASDAPGAAAPALRRAALGGWAIGSPRFAAEVAEACARPAAPRPRGRPRRAGP
jgi:putative transposase